jgi:hypothetical protein
MKLLFVFFIVGCYLCDYSNGFNCPNEHNRMYSNIDDPHSFWHCVHGHAYLKPCPQSLVWSQERHKCDKKSKSSSEAISAKTHFLYMFSIKRVNLHRILIGYMIILIRLNFFKFVSNLLGLFGLFLS